MSSPVSPQSSDEAPVAFRKPRANVFTVMLVIALLAILFSIGLLYAHMKQDFDNKIKGGPTPTASLAAPMLWQQV